MGSLIQTFTFDRNTFRRTNAASLDLVTNHIEMVVHGAALDKTASNIVGALASYMGIFVKVDGKLIPTRLAEIFLTLYAGNKADSWRWLIARSLWRFVVPNGTGCKVNGPAETRNAKFAFFHSIVQLLTHLSALSGENRYLFFEELCRLLDVDANWKCDGGDLFALLMKARSEANSGFNSERSFLDDLENSPTHRGEFDIPRDNFNGLILNAFGQTGFFQFRQGANAKTVAIALDPNLDAVLQRRLRFILDHPPIWNGTDWPGYMDYQAEDLPQEVATEDVEEAPETTIESTELNGLIAAIKERVDSAKLVVTTDQLLRFVSCLESKRFLILTGLAGSGKTKLAQAFARWITPSRLAPDIFSPGSRIDSERTTYYVKKSDDLSVEFWNAEDEAGATKVTLPREMIAEWANYIEKNSISAETPAREIRETVKALSKFSDQLHSFETHLKAAALALLKSRTDLVADKCYELVPVGADWTGNENIVGYPDGLRSPCLAEDGSSVDGAYFKKPALDLIIHAKEYKDIPHFLILDEMNLSHVERYFADLLSMIESHESITLYCDAKGMNGKPKNTRGVDPILRLPPNLFIIGTVNVDETTYMFSPKVLDRANVIEFRVTETDMKGFLDNPEAPDLAVLEGKGAIYGEAFVAAANNSRASIPIEVKDRFNAEMNLFFAVLREHGAEFGYRTAHESARFLYFYKLLGNGKVWNPKADGGNGDWTSDDDDKRDWFDHAFDAVIIQKFLPKLHGSKIKLGPLLRKVYTACVEPRTDTPRVAKTVAEKLNDNKSAAQLKEPSRDFPSDARYPVTAEKISRMWRQLSENGFTSFPEN